MKIIRLTWEKINWSAYNTLGYNYIENSGVIYATTKEKAKALCPIVADEGKIYIKEIEVIE